ncbi:MAG: hypothetical protein KGH87_08080 [Thaumarchaeota archaeon]|nr:hypothetical protein [Nitrososphaerota archaeon]MDE1839861.1 hypothetical protein [Nitrososphaerota archaeon]
MKTRNKIILLVAIASLAAYVSLAISPVVGLSLLAVSPLLLCLTTCGIAGGVIGGAAWFNRSKTKQHDSMGTGKKSKECC